MACVCGFANGTEQGHTQELKAFNLGCAKKWGYPYFWTFLQYSANCGVRYRPICPQLHTVDPTFPQLPTVDSYCRGQNLKTLIKYGKVYSLTCLNFRCDIWILLDDVIVISADAQLIR